MLHVANLRRTKLKNWYEYYRETCPICNKTGGCMINGKGDTVVCIRTESEVQFSLEFPSRIHRLKERRSHIPSNDLSLDYMEGNKKECEHTLDFVYRGLIDCTRFGCSFSLACSPLIDPSVLLHHFSCRWSYYLENCYANNRRNGCRTY